MKDVMLGVRALKMKRMEDLKKMEELVESTEELKKDTQDLILK
jgi:hypothetical protein